jgi:SAM-dependent methyltransferase
VRLAPEGLFVPAATMRVLLGRRGHLEILVAGHGMEPAVKDGEMVTVASGREPAVGDVLLCDCKGWCDLLRARRRTPGGEWVVGLDAYPRRHAVIGSDRCLGVVGRARVRTFASHLLAAMGLGAMRFAWRRVQTAAVSVPEECWGVGEKYRQQVGEYREVHASNLTDEHIGLLRRHVPAGGEVLVGGCGAGGEVVHLARLGWRVTGFDLLPEMIEAARAVVSDARAEARLFVADLRTVDLWERRFDAIYLTPLLYSFIAGRTNRVDMLSRLRRHLAPHGATLFSVKRIRTITEWLQVAAASGLHGHGRVPGYEHGDWYTWFLRPDGTLGHSYLHRFGAGEVVREVRKAGFAHVEIHRAHVLASGPEPG